MQIRSVGIDLGKATFHLVALSAAGKVLLRKKFTQKQLITFTANIQISLIGMEACSGAHFLGRALQEQGHDVKLIPAQFVKPFVKSNKNDFLDAEAIAEAVDRQNMRFVPIKTDDQLDLQALHRVRDRLIARRTSVINQLRAFLLERGMTFAKTPAKLKVSASIKPGDHDYHLHVVELHNTGPTSAMTLAAFVALCSGVFEKPIQQQMVILGRASLGGNIVPVENLAESLQVAFDAGAKRLLLPMASVKDISTIPGELFAKFQTGFYADPVDAVFKALGVQ
jgi:Transposase/Lon protease (S16) C-terminal proteolytic domain